METNQPLNNDQLAAGDMSSFIDDTPSDGGQSPPPPSHPPASTPLPHQPAAQQPPPGQPGQPPQQAQTPQQQYAAELQFLGWSDDDVKGIPPEQLGALLTKASQQFVGGQNQFGGPMGSQQFQQPMPGQQPGAMPQQQQQLPPVPEGIERPDFDNEELFDDSTRQTVKYLESLAMQNHQMFQQYQSEQQTREFVQAVDALNSPVFGQPGRGIQTPIQQQMTQQLALATQQWGGQFPYRSIHDLTNMAALPYVNGNGQMVNQQQMQGQAQQQQQGWLGQPTRTGEGNIPPTAEQHVQSMLDGYGA